jgi:imidazole glycerol-phosphate synthase subunit HisH
MTTRIAILDYGMGNLRSVEKALEHVGVVATITADHSAGVPILGICLGLQLLFDSTTELGGAAGLGLLEGETAELEADGLKVPHIGWSPVRWERESRLTEGIESETPFYFVHSFAPRPSAGELLGSATYGARFACAAERDNVFGVQFHPEKSSGAGLRLLANFTGVCASVPA